MAAEQPYEYTDKVIAYLNKRFIELFEPYNALSTSDEVNILSKAKGTYEQLAAITKIYLLKIAIYYYHKNHGHGTKIDATWLALILNDYDAVTKYVYTHEVERKMARFAESMVASDDRESDVLRALHLWSRMINEYAIRVTDRAGIQAMKDRHVKRVRWVTTIDDRTCKICRGRNGVIYPIDSIPSKPHFNCRCYVEPVA